MKKVPVLILAFNRADHVEQAMKAISDYKPERLYLECDGARHNKSGETEAVEATRKAMLDAIDWECEVKTLFRDENLGCANAVYGAISWFFEHEEFGVIIEDDIVANVDFFKLCEELLPLYKDNDDIMHINSQNYNPKNFQKGYSSNQYVFGKAMYCWGWASWARAWKKMDMNMSGWPNFDKLQMMKYFGLFKTLVQIYYWNGDYKRIQTKVCNSWATRWNFSIVENNGICISPKVNLSHNIGMDGGTHYGNNDKNPYSNLCVGNLEFPLEHPSVVNYDKEQLDVDNKDFIRIRMAGLRKKFHV